MLTDAPIRCQRLIMWLSMYYSVKAEYVPGKLMAISDSLSRDVVVTEASSKETFENEIKCYSVRAINSIPISATKLDIIINKEQQDDVLSQVTKYTINEWPDEITSDLSSYHLSRHDFSVFDNLLLYKNRVVIPLTLRKEILKRIHGHGHLSITKCRDRSQRSVWWPGISSELSKYIDNRRQNRAEPVKMTELPELPWQQIWIDLFELEGNRYLIAVENFSRWFETVKLFKIDASTVIKASKNIFAVFGITSIVVSDRSRVAIQFNII